jgi:glycosyltransferase involved in cell wall biosynthesis
LSDLKDGSWRTRIGAIRKWRDIYGRWRRYRSTELPAISTADIILGHSWNNGREYERDLKRPVLYFPNPLSAVEVKRQPASPPVFILAGAINSTVSRTGLRFLTREVLPHISDILKSGRLTIRVIGGGTLEEPFMETLRSTTGVELTGYLHHDQLEAEYANCQAMLVPTPLPVGFRTRIVDAFRHGIPVVAHTANQSGFRELKSGTNCYLAGSGREFAEKIRMLVAEPDRGQTVAATALAEFEASYSVDAYSRFLLKAVADFRNVNQGR